MRMTKVLAFFMTIVMVFCCIPIIPVAEAASETFKDMPHEGHWSAAALKSAVNNNLLNGFKEADGIYIKPDAPLTRAQMAAIANRAFGAQKKAPLTGVKDVDANAWYAEDLQKAVYMGTMKLDTYMRPNDNITRQEAFTILARAFKMTDGTVDDLSGFADNNLVAGWAVPGVGALVKNGYVKGDGNLLAPEDNITRAQFAVVMDNMIKQYITRAGIVTSVVPGNVMVNVPGVTLKDATVSGDLIIGDGVGDEDVILENVTVTGNLVIRGGGENSVIIKGGGVEGKVVVAKVDGRIRVSVEEGAGIEVVVINDGKDDVIIEGTIGTVEVAAPEVPVVVQNGTVGKIEVTGEGGASITVAGDAAVNDVVVGSNASGTTLNVEGRVAKVETSAVSTIVSGTGTVNTVTVKEGADNTAVTTPSTKVNNEGASGVTAGGGAEVPPNSSATNDDKGADIVTKPPSSGGGSGGSGSVAVSAISVTPKELTLTVGETGQITATVTPSNATNKKVNWSSSDETIATVDENGAVTAVAVGTATITATSDADSSKKDSCVVTIEAKEPAFPVLYYTGKDFNRSFAPIVDSSGNVVQTINADGSITITVNDEDYIDSGFVLEAGKLGELGGITVEGTGEYGLNLYFDLNKDGEFFDWDGNNFEGVGADAYALYHGAIEDGVLTVTDATKFNLMGTGGGIHTVAELKAKYGADTKIGIWIGVTSPNGSEKTATISKVIVAEPTPRDITVQSFNQTYIFDSYYKGLNSTFSFGGNDLLEKTVTIKAELYGAENKLLATSVYKDVNSLLNAWKNQQSTGKLLMAVFVVSGDVTEEWETTWTDGNPSKDNVPAKVVMTVIDDIGQTHTAEESNITSMPPGTTWEDLFPSDWGELADTSWYDDSQTSFTISTAAELAGLAELVNSGTNFSGKTINLGADIDLLNLEWIPIGTKENPFRGKFNGADKEISNLKIDAPEATNVGLFGYVTGGSLSNLKLKDVEINAKEAVGALVGNVRGLSEPISNIEGRFIDIQSTHWAGGLIGYSYASVKDCSVDEANVTLTYDTSINDNGDKAGGITGYQGEGNFYYENCRTSNVEIVGVRDVGGLVGASQYNVYYINCHVEFSVIKAEVNDPSFEHAQPYAGGLIGRAAGSVTLFDCSATPGGIIDDVFVPGVIVSSYKDGFAGELVGGPVSNVTIAKVLNSTQKKAYETIQVAIDGAEADNTILVSAGTFDEDITIKRSIKLFGANAGINPNNTDWSLAERRPETVFTGFIKAEAGVENIEIDGFKFTKGANGEGGALNFTLGGHTTIKIYNCIAEDTYANAEHRGSGFMYVTNHGPGGPRNGTVEFINNRLINTHGSNTAGTSGVLIWSTNNVIANGNYFSRTDEETGMTSNAALNLLGQFGTVEIKNNYFDDMIIKLDGTSFDADAIIGNVFTGREGKSNILEFTTIRTPEEIEFLAENNTYSPEGLGYVAMEPVRLGDKGYTTIQAAVSAATVGDNTIKVYPGDYGTESIDIVQKEGVNITIEAVGEVTLKNQIRIDGAARANGAETLTIKGFTFDFSTANHSIITTTFLEEVEGRSTNLVYAHNVSIENCEFIGSPEVDVVAVAAGAPGGHRNFVIKNCTGTNLHSLGQLRVQGVTVENCNVSASEGGLNLQNSTDIKITNLTVSAPMDVDSYGVRTGQDSGTVNENNTMLISNSNLIAKYPIWLRGDAPGKVIVINSELTMDDIRDVANGQVTVIIDPPVYNKDIDAYYMTLQDAIKAASSGNIINIFGDCSIIGTSFVDKNLTFVGNSSKPKIEFPQGKDQPNYQTYYGCEFTFENLTLQCEPDKNYQGIQPDKVIARNCVINGKFWGYAKDLEFTDCVFNQNSSYNVWTYGSNVTFENCEFNSAGRSVLIYNEGATLEVPAKIVFKNCTFSASTTVDMKAAIDIDTRFASFIVEIENCSANGFSNVTEPGGITIIPGFIHLKVTDNGSLTVTVDGVQVYSLVPVTEVSLDKAEIILVADETETLIATVAPANATNKEVTWSSSDETVATVDENGKVTAVAAGKATITATSAADSSRKATCTVTVRAVSDIADVITGDFSVMTISDVIGYNVGFILSDAIALDVKEVVVKLYKGDTVLATNISTGLMEQYPNETSLSAPFDVSGSFDYEEDGCWDYSGWEGDNADIPTKAEIIVKFKNGVVKTAINENLTGDTDIFSKIDAAISALNQHIGSVVNTNKLMEALQHEDLGLDAVVDEYLMNYAQALQEKYAEDNSFQFETIAEIQAFIDEVNSGVEELIRTVNEANNANELYKALSSEKLFSWYDFWDSESGRGVVRSNREVYFAELQVLRQENSELTTKAQIKSFVDAANLTPVGQVNLASLVTSFRSALTNPELGLNLEAYNNLNGVVRNTVSDTMFNRVKDDDISFVNAEQIQELLDEIINEAITEEFDIITLDNAMAEAAKGAAETKQDVEDAVAELEVAVSAFNDAKQETINEEEIEESGQGEEPAEGEEPEEDEEQAKGEEPAEDDEPIEDEAPAEGEKPEEDVEPVEGEELEE